jgi:(p)ppGpp synthase/HD superfamily hydrolase
VGKEQEIASRHPDDHPFKVAFLCQEFDKPVALLHDSLEDGYATLQELEIWFDAAVVADVVTLTHLPGEDYTAYIKRIKRVGGRARRVKLADLHTNLARCYDDPDKYRSLIARYLHAVSILEAK